MLIGDAEGRDLGIFESLVLNGNVLEGRGTSRNISRKNGLFHTGIRGNRNSTLLLDIARGGVILRVGDDHATEIVGPIKGPQIHIEGLIWKKQ